MANFLFYLFASMTVGCALAAVLNKNAVNAAMSLLLCLAAVAGMFVLLDSALLAFVLLLVYAGAVVALFLFIIMLLDTRDGVRRPFRPMTMAAATIGLALLVLGLVAIAQHSDSPGPANVAPVGIALKPYAEQLFTIYLLPVQVVGFLLLISMLGVIVLSKKLAAPEDAK